MLRQPVVAGMFYSEDTEDLRADLESLWPTPNPEPMEAFGAMVPHAGYIYSGRTAAAVYARLKPADIYIILGPNHTGRGSALALTEAKAWKTPLGKVPIARELAEVLCRLDTTVCCDETAHNREHSVEVHLPFIQTIGQDFSILPIVLGTLELERLRTFGMALAQSIRESKKNCLIIASSDMDHFHSLARTQQLDQLALEKMSHLDPAGLLHTVQQHKISMCGVGPAVAMLIASLALGANKSELVAYTTSAETSGDTQRVVGYAGVIVS